MAQSKNEKLLGKIREMKRLVKTTRFGLYKHQFDEFVKEYVGKYGKKGRLVDENTLEIDDLTLYKIIESN